MSSITAATPTHLDVRARDAAFALAFGAGTRPDAIDTFDRPGAEALLAATGAPPARCLEAALATKQLGAAALEVADQVRDGAFGPHPDDPARARLARLAPGFTDAQYDVALARGAWFTR